MKSDNLTVLVVWEPILPSDWSRPTRLVMARIPDRRVIQFWDKDHLIAKQLDTQLRTIQKRFPKAGPPEYTRP